MDNMPQRPNEAGETPVIVRWMVETPAGWLGAYNREAFDAYAEQRCAPLVEALQALVNADQIHENQIPWRLWDQARAALAAQEKQHG